MISLVDESLGIELVDWESARKLFMCNKWKCDRCGKYDNVMGYRFVEKLCSEC